MRVDDFKWNGQMDRDDFELRLYGDGFPDGELVLWFGCHALMDLHEQLGSYFADSIREMNAARASHARGEGPNGEPRGAWEADRDDVYEDSDPKSPKYLEHADALRDSARGK